MHVFFRDPDFLIICDRTDNSTVLLTMHLFQGIGAAPPIMLTAALPGDLYAGDRFVATMGTWSGFQAVSLVFVPYLGGILGNLGWGYPFLLSATALPLSLATLLFLKLPSVKVQQSFISHFSKAFRAMMQPPAPSALFAVCALMVLIYGVILTCLSCS